MFGGLDSYNYIKLIFADGQSLLVPAADADDKKIFESPYLEGLVECSEYCEEQVSVPGGGDGDEGEPSQTARVVRVDDRVDADVLAVMRELFAVENAVCEKEVTEIFNAFTVYKAWSDVGRQAVEYLKKKKEMGIADVFPKGKYRNNLACIFLYDEAKDEEEALRARRKRFQLLKRCPYIRDDEFNKIRAIKPYKEISNKYFKLLRPVNAIEFFKDILSVIRGEEPRAVYKDASAELNLAMRCFMFCSKYAFDFFRAYFYIYVMVPFMSNNTNEKTLAKDGKNGAPYEWTPEFFEKLVDVASEAAGIPYTNLVQISHSLRKLWSPVYMEIVFQRACDTHYIRQWAEKEGHDTVLAYLDSPDQPVQSAQDHEATCAPKTALAA